MKVLITNYTFNKANRTITFEGYTGGITLAQVLLVVNATDGITLYSFADPSKGGSVAGNVLTLDYDTNGMDNADSLLVYYDDPEAKEDVDRSPGDSLPFNHRVSREIWMPYHRNAFTTGVSVGTQGRRVLGKVTVNKAGGTGTTLTIKDDYYASGGGPTRLVIDTTVIGTKEYNILFNVGIWLIQTDPGGSVAAADITLGFI